jgi:F-type H+-transporting ATPase subunit b
MTTTATTTVPAQEHEASFLGLDAPFFVALSMAVVIAIILAQKVPAIIGAALDKQIAAIRRNLDDAKRLRAEAEALRAEYEAKAAAAAADADDIRKHAEIEAHAMLDKARADADALIERRARMAEDKIGAAERAAIAEVRARAATAAAGAAAQLIGERHDAASDKALVDRTIARLN